MQEPGDAYQGALSALDGDGDAAVVVFGPVDAGAGAAAVVVVIAAADVAVDAAVAAVDAAVGGALLPTDVKDAKGQAAGEGEAPEEDQELNGLVGAEAMALHCTYLIHHLYEYPGPLMSA